MRSLLFVPGDPPDKMKKALSARADALILDLEDSVAFANKQRAREETANFLQRKHDDAADRAHQCARQRFRRCDLEAVMPHYSRDDHAAES